jgi:2-dehydropantoate 2-reductase
LTVGELMDDPNVGPISQAAAVEAWTVARALGIGISVDDPIKLIREFAIGMRGAKPSLLQDHEKQRFSEIEVINGAVPPAAAKVGLTAPVNATLTALVKQREACFPSRGHGSL